MDIESETGIGASAPGRALECWVVTEGRAGLENQAMGLAEAVARLTPLRITPKRMRVRNPWRKIPRFLWGDPFSYLSPSAALLRPPFPDLWIACGRLSTPFTIAVKKRSPETFTVQTQAPRAPRALFDFIVAPQHDRLAGENVLPIVGSPHRLTAEKISVAGEQLAPALSCLGEPRIAVLIGGANRAYALRPARMRRLGEQLRALAEAGAGLMITGSRRTDLRALEALRSALEGVRYYFWDGSPIAGLANPYAGMLGLADHIVLTCDSVNMAVEAAATGKPVHVVSLDPSNIALSAAKFERFHAALRERGVARPFTGHLNAWRYEPLDETARAAGEVAARFMAWRKNASTIDRTKQRSD